MPVLNVIISGLICLICLASFLLSLWIVIPAPIFSLLPLSVGTSEISPILILVNAIITIGLLITIGKFQSHFTHRLALSLITAALIITILPLSQLPKAQQQADRAMQAVIQIPPDIQPNHRSHPFILADVFRGIPESNIRYTPSIQFSNLNNVPLTLNLYQPAKVGRYPAIVVIYGGAWQRGNPNQDAAFSRYMAGQGYVVWAISYRHAPQYRFPAQLEDVRNALNFVKQHAIEYETDLNRLALMGRSAGAQLAMVAAYEPSELKIRAVVDYYGPVNLTTGYYQLPTPDPIGSQAVLRSYFGGTPEEFPGLYHQASPINAVKPGLPPTLLIYGSRDHIVESKYGRGLAQSLTAQGNQVVFIEIPWADHAFDSVFQGVSNQFALYYTERFLAWALQPVEEQPGNLFPG
jgi:acetyl esterase/lipase